jgi:hypothetical protein
MLVLLAIEAAQHLDITRRVTVAITILLAFGVLTGASGLEGAGNDFRQRSLPGKDGATAIEIAGQYAPYEFGQADPTQPGPFLLVNGPYREALADYGSGVGYTEEELRRAAPDRQLGVDQALVRVHGATVFLAPADTPTLDEPLTVRTQDRGAAESIDGGCVRFTPDGDDASFSVDVPWTGILVKATDAETQVRLRRFSPLWPNDQLGTLAPKRAGLVKPAGPDEVPEQLFVAQMRSAAPVEVCTAR